MNHAMLGLDSDEFDELSFDLADIRGCARRTSSSWAASLANWH